VSDSIPRSVPLDGDIAPARRATFEIHPATGSGFIAGLAFGAPSTRFDVLFLHANGFNASTYRQILAPLGDTLSILAVDLRGHGRTRLPPPTGAPDWFVHRDDVLALIEVLGVVPRVVAGHSLGGTTALLTSPKLPADTRLVLLDPVMRGDLPPVVEPEWDMPLAALAARRRRIFASRDEAFASYRGRGAFKTWPDAILADYLVDGLEPAPEGMLQLSCSPESEAKNFASYRMVDAAAVLAKPALPTTVLQAGQGTSMVLGRYAEAVAASGLVQVETVPGTTHFLPMERPEIVQRTLVDAVTSSRQAIA